MRNILFRIFLLALALGICPRFAVAQTAAPWEVNPSAYRYDMSLYLDFTFGVNPVDFDTYSFAAFVGEECRGVGKLLKTDAMDRPVVYLRAYSNSESGEKLTFKYYNVNTGETEPVESIEIPFVSDTRVGVPSDPYKVVIIRHFNIDITAGEGGTVDSRNGRLPEDLTFEATAVPDTGYHFVEWSDGSTENPRAITVTEDMTLSASFDLNTYKLTYKVDGVETESLDVTYKDPLTAIDEPSKVGYTFSGWQGLPATMPAEDVVVTGEFIINQYRLIFKAGDTVVSDTEVDYNSVITAPQAPAKTGYTFTGWEEFPANMPADDLTVNGSYTINSYKLTYKVDGENYREIIVEYDSQVIAIEEPSKVGYTFSGWTGVPEKMPAGDVVVTGDFTINKYLLIFKIGDTVVSDTEVDYNSVITAPDAPAKEGHTFAGWEEFPSNMPAGDLTVNGSYTVNKYKVTYMLEGETEPFAEQEVDYGTAIPAIDAPEKEGYTFTGWENLPDTMPAGDIVVTGGFTINKYHLIFKIGETVVSDTEVDYNSVITAPDAPAKEGHTFAGWEEYPSNMPAGDLTVNGSYTVNKYKITYMLEGETEPFAEQEVDYGTAIPSIDAPEKEGYTFTGWRNIPDTMPAEDVVVTGGFTINKYHLIFKAYDTVVSESDVEYGSEIVEPEAPQLEGRTLVGWEEHPATMPANDLIINAIYTVNKYKITYMLEDEIEPFAVQEVDYGTSIPAIDSPEKEGYTFAGWENLPDTMPAEDIVVTGSFNINSYTLTIYLDDKVYSTEEVEYGAKLDITEPEVTSPDRIFDKWLEELPATMPAHNVELHAVTKEYSGIAAILDIREGKVDVYDIHGILVKKNLDVREAENLAPGIYIINGVKILKSR